MPAKMLPLRNAATCAECGCALAVGSLAWWSTESRSASCASCGASVDADATPIATGEAGGSARREYERQHRRREQALDRRWGALAGMVKFMSEDPQSITAWAKGSEGERRLAEHLLRAVGDRALLLHDLTVPGRRVNIDHVVIAASGIWVVDAKKYSGLVERRDVGGWFKTDMRVYVKGRDRTKLVGGLGWQVDAVRAATGTTNVPINAAVCFVAAEWKLFTQPFQLDGVWVTWPKRLAHMIAEPGPLTAVDVSDTPRRIVAALPPQAANT